MCSNKQNHATLPIDRVNYCISSAFASAYYSNTSVDVVPLNRNWIMASSLKVKKSPSHHHNQKKIAGWNRKLVMVKKLGKVGICPKRRGKWDKAGDIPL